MTTLIAESRQRARKHHRCDNCQCSIAPGEVYLRQRSVCDGTLYVWKSHIDCMELAWKIGGGDYTDGDPPLCGTEREYVTEWRGYYPHAVCRVELGWALAEQRYRSRRK